MTACKWDVVIPLEPLWAHYGRLLKPRGAVVLTACQPFTSLLVTSNPRWFRYCLVWDKLFCTGWLDAKRRPLRSHEEICVFARSGPKYNPQMWRGNPNHKRTSSPEQYNSVNYRGGLHKTESDLSGNKYPRSIIRIPKHTSREKLHPTQKPVALMEYLIRTYSDEGDTVLDNVAGSFTTGIACINTNRNFIGIEKEENWFEAGRGRMEGAKATVIPPLGGKDGRGRSECPDDSPPLLRGIGSM